MDNKFTRLFKEKKLRAKEKRLVKKIEEGFKNNEFKMHLQFIVCNKTKKIVSAEALSRWESVAGEYIFPGEYIGVMEKSGIIVKFDYYMFDKVCEKLSKWKGTEFEHITISCNITRITISEKDFAAKLKQIAEKYDFDRSKLIIEITEDTVEKNMKIAKQNINDASELGFTIAIDDIGSGYTSLVSLCEYPIDIVKIDRNVLLMCDKDCGKKLFTGIISLIHGLNLKAVCEGVETDEQNAFVTETDCDFVQGWYFSKCHSETDAEKFYKEYMNNL